MYEIKKYEEYIPSKREKTFQKESFEYALKFLFESIQIIPEELYSQNMEKAYNELKNIDEKDTPFLALALQIECPMWSDDHHLHQQSKIKVYNTKEYIMKSNNKNLIFLKKN